MPIPRSIAMLLAVPAAYAQAPAPMQVPNVPVEYFGVTFPTEVGGAPRISVRDYESENPGLGYSAGYRHGEATSTIYIYDNRVPSIPDDVKSAALRSQFEQAKADIGRVPQVSIKAKSAFTLHDKSKRDRLICQGYAMTRQQDSRAFDTFVCLGVFKGKFLKVRTTMPQTANAEAEVRRFVGLWVEQLWNPSAAAR